MLGVNFGGDLFGLEVFGGKIAGNLLKFRQTPQKNSTRIHSAEPWDQENTENGQGVRICTCLDVLFCGVLSNRV